MRGAVRFGAAALAALVLCGLAQGQELVVTHSNPSGVYAVGETIAWRVELRGEGAAQATELRYVLKENGLTPLREGTLPLADGQATLTAKLEDPGTLLAELGATVGDKTIKRLAGAAVEPASIGPSLPRPEGFDSFWRAKLAELAAVPANPVLEPVDSGKPEVEYYKVRMDNIRGTHIHGQLAKPKGDGRFPATLVVQWAGVYPLEKSWVLWRAENGWLTLNIMAHDLPFDQPQAYYEKAAEGALKDYPAIGNDDRETSYFLRMYLSCVRAAEYLTQRPDWDGRTLVVMGGSQGGMQAIVTAALHPKVTAAIAVMPAGCDLNGPEVGRAPAWPMWYWRTEGKDPEKVRQAARYFDVVNFASRVTCPTLVGMGLVDTTCPASGVFAMTNQLRGPKEVVVMPDSGHGGPNDVLEEREKAWLEALKHGGGPPLAAAGR